MSEIHYGKCEKCNYMGGLNNNLICLCCLDEKALLNKRAKREIQTLEALLIEACDVINSQAKWKVLGESERRKFLNKPEIKKLLLEGEE